MFHLQLFLDLFPTLKNVTTSEEGGGTEGSHWSMWVGPAPVFPGEVIPPFLPSKTKRTTARHGESRRGGGTRWSSLPEGEGREEGVASRSPPLCRSL